MDLQQALDQLNREYLEVHVPKEELFWQTYMGHGAPEGAFEEAERAYKAWTSDHKRAALTRDWAEQARRQNHRAARALDGWRRFFEVNAIESAAARTIMNEIIDLEGAMFKARAKLVLTYTNEQGARTPASTLVLAGNLRTSDHAGVRKSSHEALLELEQWVLRNGFLDLVYLRNRFARELGYDDYFDYSVQKNEQMSAAELGALLDEFEQLTRDKCMGEVQALGERLGAEAIEPHNFNYFSKGDAEKEIDPYLPFAKSLTRWAESFTRLGIRYRGARLQLDLLDRKGKYENGFMHGPHPAFFDGGAWRPARINFTSNANPDQIGSGRHALETLFHEGGHAAHFANVTLDAPCFSQEFAPTSMAHAETQSMFLDSLIGDGDWMALYARDTDGKPVPDSVIRAIVTADQPLRAFNERRIMNVSRFERRLYAMDDKARTPKTVTALARQREQEDIGLPCSPRPLLSIPHLLHDDSACCYHGYLLAEMAVFQTRAHFLEQHGYLADNPEIGPALYEHYWRHGNARSHGQMVRELTGKPFSAADLAAKCNLGSDTLWDQEQARIKAAKQRDRAPVEMDLEADIAIVHGTSVIADNHDSTEGMCHVFEEWINEGRYSA